MKTQRKSIIAAALVCVATFFAPRLSADMLVNDMGGTLEITASSAYAGKGIVLLWDEEDKGDTVADWANQSTIVDAVPSSGGTYIVDLNALFITNGQPCRIAACTTYRLLDKVYINGSTGRVDTGVKDSDVYGLRMGYYCTSTANGGVAIGTGGTSTQFMLQSTADARYLKFVRHGSNLFNTGTTLSTDSINEIALTNGVFTANGVKKAAYTFTGSFGTSDGTVKVGGISNSTYFHCGWWSHVSLDDSSGERLIDYIPAQRSSDSAVGFWDRKADAFVVSTTGSAGTFTNAYVNIAESSQTVVPTRNLTVVQEDGACTVTIPSGLAGEDLLVLWDTEDKSATGEWANTNVVATSVASGATITTGLGRFGVKNGNYAVLAARHNLSRLDMMYIAGNTCRIDTGVKDSLVYGFRIGYYCTETPSSNNYGVPFGTGGSTGQFMLQVVNTNKAYLKFKRGSSEVGTISTLSTSSINEIAATNKVYSLDGTSIKAYTFTDAFGSSGSNVLIGGLSSSWYQKGWWSHVSLDDVSGNRLIDYVAAKRNSDGVVGFYDRASGVFVTPTTTATATAGTVTDAEYYPVNAVGEPFEVTCIQGLIIIFR